MVWPCVQQGAQAGAARLQRLPVTLLLVALICPAFSLVASHEPPMLHYVPLSLNFTLIGRLPLNALTPILGEKTRQALNQKITPELQRFFPIPVVLLRYHSPRVELQSIQVIAHPSSDNSVRCVVDTTVRADRDRRTFPWEDWRRDGHEDIASIAVELDATLTLPAVPAVLASAELELNAALARPVQVNVHTGILSFSTEFSWSGPLLEQRVELKGLLQHLPPRVALIITEAHFARASATLSALDLYLALTADVSFDLLHMLDV